MEMKNGNFRCGGKTAWVDIGTDCVLCAVQSYMQSRAEVDPVGDRRAPGSA